MPPIDLLAPQPDDVNVAFEHEDRVYSAFVRPYLTFALLCVRGYHLRTGGIHESDFAGEVKHEITRDQFDALRDDQTIPIEINGLTLTVGPPKRRTPRVKERQATLKLPFDEDEDEDADDY